VGEHISISLTLPLRRRAGEALAPKLCQYLRPKIHPLLLDGAINCQHTICLNIYQVRRPPGALARGQLGCGNELCCCRALPPADPLPGRLPVSSDGGSASSVAWDA
jgi:hypothetical protein